MNINYCFKCSRLVQTMVGLNKRLLEMVDHKGYLPLQYAAGNCLHNIVIKFIISMHPQALIIRTKRYGCLLLHLLLQFNFRQNSLEYFSDSEYLQSMHCFDKDNSKFICSIP